jgi:RNA polymerase sigma-70 factor, ECF subfamily
MTKIEFQFKLVNLQVSLMRFAYRLTSDKDDANDLFQETCLKALIYQDKFVFDENLRAWTFTIMKNTFINNYRRSVRFHYYNDQIKEEYYPNHALASGAENPDSVYASNELEKIIETLDDNFKLPFKMHHEGFKYREIAETLDLKIGTVKSRVFFAKKKLIKQLSK